MSFSGNFFQKSSSTYLTLCLITPHSKFAPLRSNDRRTGSVAVHAMLGAKWSALANQWVNVQRLSIGRILRNAAQDLVVSKEEKPSTGVLSPPLAQEILSLNAKISKPPRVYYHWLRNCTRPHKTNANLYFILPMTREEGVLPYPCTPL